ncbi:MAG: penicillin-binding transpeptidase domain-containing protein, partial [Thermocrispum sp.]
EAAEGESARALVQAANSLGLNSNFAIPGIATEAGAVRKVSDALQLAELRQGHGEAKASPFGLALVAATVAAGKQVTPQFWASDPTKVIKSYPPPGEETLTAMRAALRANVTDGSASALQSRGEVHGVTGTAKAGNGVRHSWFAGYADDVAFAVLVEDGGSERPAVAVSGKFLGGF